MAAGLLKPGLNTVLTPKDSERPKTNNIDGLRQKLAEFRQDQPWIERLDMANKPAPLAPELGKVFHITHNVNIVEYFVKSHLRFYSSVFPRIFLMYLISKIIVF